MGRYPKWFGSELVVSTAEEIRQCVKERKPCRFQWPEDSRATLFRGLRRSGRKSKEIGRFLDLAADAIAYAVHEKVFFAVPATPKEDSATLEKAISDLKSFLVRLKSLGPEGEAAIGDFDWARRPEIMWHYNIKSMQVGNECPDYVCITASKESLSKIINNFINIFNGGKRKLENVPDRSGKRYTSARIKNRLVSWLVVAHEMVFNEYPPITKTGPFDQVLDTCFSCLSLKPVGDYRNRVKAAIKLATRHAGCRGKGDCSVPGDRHNCPYPQFLNSEVD